MKKKTVLVLLCLILSLSACGKEAKVLDQEGSFTDGKCTYLEEGLIYTLMLGNAVYYEYDTGTYMPLCAKANCRHNTDECMAMRLSSVERLGKIGDKWYYLMVDGYNMSLYSADLDGQNEKKIGTVGYGVGSGCLFYDDSCIYVMDEATYCAIDEHTGTFKDYTSTIRRFDFEEQKEETLTPELFNESYEIYGRYEDQLIYEEMKKEGFFVKILDLETGEVTDFIDKTDRFLYGKLSGNVFVYMVREDGRSENYRVMELDLDTGEQKEIWKYSGDMATGYVRFAWSPEIKAFSISDFEEDRRKTYQYLEDGSCVLIREEKSSPDYPLLAAEGGRIITEFTVGRDQYLATMSIKDFTAGKDNWTRLEY